MKFLHISDLHFGKTMNGCPLVEKDQPYWCERFLEAVDETGAEAVVIAGDVYDRSSPSNEAVKLFDKLVSSLAARDIPVLIVAGNHDSGQKLSFASTILDKSGVHIAGVLSREITHVKIKDVTFWLVPYLFPAAVNSVLECSDIKDYSTAMKRILDEQDIDYSKQNVIVCHQNITRNGVEAERGGSESMVAGVGGIEYTVFDGFEYAALGHIHASQYVGRPEVRYAGSPLCYHFDETKFPSKGAVFVELKGKGNKPEITVIPIKPLHPVRSLTGTYDELKNELQNTENRGEYLRAEITDKRTSPDICDTLRSIAASHDSTLAEIVSSFTRIHAETMYGTDINTEKASLSELFAGFFAFATDGNEIPDEKDTALISMISEAINGDNGDTENETCEKISKLIIKECADLEKEVK